MARIRKPLFKRFHAPLPAMLRLERHLPFVPCDYCGYNTPIGLMKVDQFGKHYCWRHPFGDQDHQRKV